MLEHRGVQYHALMLEERLQTQVHGDEGSRCWTDERDTRWELSTILQTATESLVGGYTE